MDQLAAAIVDQFQTGGDTSQGHPPPAMKRFANHFDCCAARNIKADIELIRADEIDRAWERVVTKDVRYRFVIDMDSLKASS